MNRRSLSNFTYEIKIEARGSARLSFTRLDLSVRDFV